MVVHVSPDWPLSSDSTICMEMFPLVHMSSCLSLIHTLGFAIGYVVLVISLNACDHVLLLWKF